MRTTGCKGTGCHHYSYPTIIKWDLIKTSQHNGVRDGIMNQVHDRRKVTGGIHLTRGAFLPTTIIKDFSASEDVTKLRVLGSHCEASPAVTFKHFLANPGTFCQAGSGPQSTREYWSQVISYHQHRMVSNLSVVAVMQHWIVTLHYNTMRELCLSCVSAGLYLEE